MSTVENSKKEVEDTMSKKDIEFFRSYGYYEDEILELAHDKEACYLIKKRIRAHNKEKINNTLFTKLGL